MRTPGFVRSPIAAATAPVGGSAAGTTTGVGPAPSSTNQFHLMMREDAAVELSFIPAAGGEAVREPGAPSRRTLSGGIRSGGPVRFFPPRSITATGAVITGYPDEVGDAPRPRERRTDGPVLAAARRWWCSPTCWRRSWKSTWATASRWELHEGAGRGKKSLVVAGTISESFWGSADNNARAEALAAVVGGKRRTFSTGAPGAWIPALSGDSRWTAQETCPTVGSTSTKAAEHGAEIPRETGNMILTMAFNPWRCSRATITIGVGLQTNAARGAVHARGGDLASFARCSALRAENLSSVLLGEQLEFQVAPQRLPVGLLMGTRPW